MVAKPAEWITLRLGDVYEFKNGLNKEKKFFGSGTPIVNYMDVFDHPLICASHVSGKVTVSAAERSNYSARKGDVFFTRTSETVEEIGMAAVLTDDIPSAVFSGFVLRARPISDAIHPEFAGHVLRSEQVRRQIMTTASYTTRALTNGRLLSAVMLAVPPREEQVAIAQALSDMDAEIDLLTKRVAKSRRLKLGAAQELLSGRVRLV